MKTQKIYSRASSCLLVLFFILACNPPAVPITKEKTPAIDYTYMPALEQAILKKEAFLKHLVNRNAIGWETFNIYLRAFKKEEILEVWGKNSYDEKFQLITDYQFCTISGILGPKREQRDYQIPEGVYQISQFNPFSRFHLSLRVDYPNKSDRIRGNRARLGGDIYIHGDCVTIGCIPITNDKIEEVYLLANQAKSNCQGEIPIHIFPTKMTTKNLDALKTEYAEHTAFWQELKPIYEQFEATKKLGKVAINRNGAYFIE